MGNSISMSFGTLLEVQILMTQYGKTEIKCIKNNITLLYYYYGRPWPSE